MVLYATTISRYCRLNRTPRDQVLKLDAIWTVALYE